MILMLKQNTAEFKWNNRALSFVNRKHQKKLWEQGKLNTFEKLGWNNNGKLLFTALYIPLIVYLPRWGLTKQFPLLLNALLLFLLFS